MAWPLVIGAAASLAGGAIAGSANSKAAKAQERGQENLRRDNMDQWVMNNYQKFLELYGNEDDAIGAISNLLTDEQELRYLGRAPRNANFTEQEQRRIAELQQEESRLSQSTAFRGGAFATRNPRQTSNSNRLAEIRAEISAINARSGGDAGQIGMIRRTGYTAPGGGLLAEYSRLAGLSEQRTGQLIADYGRDTEQLQGGYNEMAGLASQYGRGREESIRRDAGDQERRLNQSSMASLAASGIAGSSQNFALANNSRRTQRDMQDRLNELGDSQIDRQLSIGGQRLASLNQRMAGLGAIRGTGEDRFFQLSRLPLDLRSSVTLNTGQSQTVPYAGTSGSAAFGSTIGNTIGGFGGLLAGYGMQQAFSGSGGAGGGQFGAGDQRPPYANRGG
jgi:hypothetical protein